jgi:hypothetical protein
MRNTDVGYGSGALTTIVFQLSIWYSRVLQSENSGWMMLITSFLLGAIASATGGALVGIGVGPFVLLHWRMGVQVNNT